MGRIADAIQKDIDRNLYDGCEFLIARGGSILAHEALGFSQRSSLSPLKKDAVFSLYSLSKALTATLVLDAVHQGKLALETPVAQFFSSFQRGEKHRVTILHLLTHTGGISATIPQIPFDQLGSLDTVVDAVTCEPLAFSVGEVHYSPVCGFALLGKILCLIDSQKRSFQQILWEDLLKPLSMHNTYFGLKESLKNRSVPVVFRDLSPGVFPPQLIEGLSQIFAPTSEIPGGGAIGTVHDLFLFTEALKKRPWIQMATQNYTGDRPNDLWDLARKLKKWPSFPAYLGLGLWLRGEGDFPTPFGRKASASTYGALGLGSALFWIDPCNDLTFICLTSGLMEESSSLLRFERLSDLVIQF